MRKKQSIFKIILSCVFILFYGSVWSQSPRVLSFEEAINIALNRSYTVKSYQELKTAREQNYHFNLAQFKPRLDIQLDVPQWSENVSPIERPDGLPVYNSLGSMQIGGELDFQYFLPTGGYFTLTSLMHRNNLTTILALQDYTQLKTDKAFSSLRLSFAQPIFTANQLRERLKEAEYGYDLSSSQFTQIQMKEGVKL